MMLDFVLQSKTFVSVRVCVQVLMTSIAVTTVACSSGAHQSATQSETPNKPDLTQVTSSMFVERSAVPASPPMQFVGPNIRVDTGGNPPVYPSECGPIFNGPAGTQSGEVKWMTATATGGALNGDRGGFVLS